MHAGCQYVRWHRRLPSIVQPVTQAAVPSVTSRKHRHGTGVLAPRAPALTEEAAEDACRQRSAGAWPSLALSGQNVPTVVAAPSR